MSVIGSRAAVLLAVPWLRLPQLSRTVGVAASYCMGGNCFSTTATMSSPVVIQPSGTHSATVFFMHGLGDTGHGWAPVMQMIKEPHIKYLCPHAPTNPVSLNMGLQMPSWFDIRSLDARSNEDEAGIKAAAKTVHGWIEEEMKAGIPSNRILLGGFSQGGGLALYSGFTYDKPLAGIIALSSWLPLHKDLPGDHETNKATPVFQGHGDADPLVIPAFGQKTSDHIKTFNPNHTFKTYAGLMHSACDEEFQDIKKFIAERLPPK